MNTPTIRLSEDIELPYKCDLYVLDMIQQKYGTIVEFEKQLIGIKTVPDKDENGNPINKDIKVEPSISAILFALPLMIREGLEIEQVNGEHPFKTNLDIISVVTRDYRAIADDLHSELKNCFKIKK